MSSSLAPGRFGPFHLIELIGKGGMGEVWLGTTTNALGEPTPCVVKTVRAEAADDPDLVKRFADEARLALLLVHPHISRVLDAGVLDNTRYLALGLVEDVDLHTLAKRAREQGVSIPEDVALWICIHALDALAFAHAAVHPMTKKPLGVVHRDISPANIMCACDGTARVIDFGLALSSVKQAQTAQSIVIGKMAYMAPEQARGEPVDRRSDIYAVGVVLYELLTGDRFWGDRGKNEVWLAAGSTDYAPPKLHALAPDVVGALAPMIERTREKRANDAGQCRDALIALLATRGGAVTARERLKDIVVRLAGPELARADRARHAASSLPPEAPTELDLRAVSSGPPTSLAIVDAAAVAAALAAADKNPDHLTERVERARAETPASMTAVAAPAPDAAPRAPPARPRRPVRERRSPRGPPSCS